MWKGFCRWRGPLVRLEKNSRWSGSFEWDQAISATQISARDVRRRGESSPEGGGLNYRPPAARGPAGGWLRISPSGTGTRLNGSAISSFSGLAWRSSPDNSLERFRKIAGDQTEPACEKQQGSARGKPRAHRVFIHHHWSRDHSDGLFYLPPRGSDLRRSARCCL